ncbi:MAG: polyhydroxybutyrate depolymerase, partial [Myxococcales bacterium]|nr:polyhydroxybutyrate depolymerase [Myxococcales bacterium]
MKAVLPIGLFAIVLSGGCGTTTPVAADAGGTGGALGGDGAAGTGGKVVGGDDGRTTGCGNGSLKAGNTTVMLQFGGVAREYIVYVPTSYDGSQRVPLVLDIHGLTSNATEQQLISGWRQKADATGFIVVY